MSFDFQQPSSRIQLIQPKHPVKVATVFFDGFIVISLKKGGLIPNQSV
jgi:hypothetical protein